MQPLDLTHCREGAWPDRLKPKGEGSFVKESFEDWWIRNLGEVGHLDKRLVEQWIYRHWAHSPFGFLHIPSLKWELKSMTTEEILSGVLPYYALPLRPESDYDVFQGKVHKSDPLPTAKALDQGTWDFPIVVLETPHGTTDLSGIFHSEPYLLVEGHSRFRYLNALHHRGVRNGPHQLYVLAGGIKQGGQAQD